MCISPMFKISGSMLACCHRRLGPDVVAVAYSCSYAYVRVAYVRYTSLYAYAHALTSVCVYSYVCIYICINTANLYLSLYIYMYIYIYIYLYYAYTVCISEDGGLGNLFVSLVRAHVGSGCTAEFGHKNSWLPVSLF